MTYNRISTGLTNNQSLQRVVYANQNAENATDAKDDEILYYSNGAPTSSSELVFDGSSLKVEGGFVAGMRTLSTGALQPTGDQSNFGGWMNLQSNIGGKYPNVPVNSGAAGFSMGWNLTGSGGEAVIMNNFNGGGQGVHFRLRTGETASNLLAAVGVTSPGQETTGSLWSKNVWITGEDIYLPGIYRIREAYRKVYNGELGPLNSPNNPSPAANRLILQSLSGGAVTAFASSIGDSNEWAYYGGLLAYKAAGNTKAWGTTTAPSSGTTVRFSTGIFEDQWAIYLINNTAAGFYWTVIWEQDFAIR